MTGVQVSIELKEQESALAELAGYIARAANPQGMFEQIGASLVTSTDQRFETGVGVDGSPWPPSLRVKAHGGKTLKLTGRLQRSVTFQATATGVEVGSNVVYAAIHQFGGEILQGARKATVHFKRDKRTGERLAGFRKAGSKGSEAQEVSIGARTIHMPARPFIGLDDDDEREILHIAEDWIAGEQKATP
jgi:phage virion morphogenesis protein